MLQKLKSVTVTVFGARALQTHPSLNNSNKWFGALHEALKKVLSLKFLSKESPTVKKPRVVILGTGWASISFLQKLDQNSIHLKIVSPRPFFFYTPLLAGSATGTVSFNSIIEPIRWYCQNSGAAESTFIQAECSTVNLKKKYITCNIQGADSNIDYDYLVVAVGAESATFGIPGIQQNAMFMKEIQDAINFRQKLLQNLEMASSLLATNRTSEEVDKLLHFVIVGGGPTGVESTAELTDFVKQEINRYFPLLAPRIKLTLLEATDRILAVFDKDTALYAESVLTQRGANVVCNATVVSATSDTITFRKNGVEVVMTYGGLIWAAGNTTRPVVKNINTQLGVAPRDLWHGLEVDSHFRVKGMDDNSLWAIGDCSESGCGPTAQAAMQQGKYLGDLFRNVILTGSRLAQTSTSALPSDQTLAPAVPGSHHDLNGYDEATASLTRAIDAYPAFKYNYKGALAYVGGSKAVAQLKSLLWDRYPTPGGDVTVEGLGAFAIWRSLYFSRLLSGRNQAQVAFDWLKTYVFGRDISSPVFTYQSQQANSIK